MTEFEKLVLDYDEFEYNYDTYGYGDAFSDDREEARAVAKIALLDKDFRKRVVNRLTEIAGENDEHTAPALELICRINALN